MILLCLVAAILPMVSISGGFLFKIRESEKENLEEKIVSEFQRVTQEMENMFSSYEMLADILGQDRQIVEVLKPRYTSLIDAQETYLLAYNKYLEALYVWPMVKGVTYYSENPSLISAPPFFVNSWDYRNTWSQKQDIADMGNVGLWTGYRYMERNEDYWSPQTSVGQDGEKVFAYSKVLGTYQNQFSQENMITVAVSEKAITEILSTLDPFFQVSLEDLSGTMVVGQQSMEDSVAMDTLTQANGTYQIQTVLQNGWRMGISCAGEEAFTEAEKIVWLNAVVLIVTTLFSTLLVVAFSHSIGKRTDYLVKKMEVMLQGNWEDQQVETGADELAQIDRHFSSLAKQLREMIQQKYVLELEKTRMQLDSLQSQVNPHFLYNALSTISWLAVDHTREEVRQSIEMLAKFYRVNLSRGKEVISLGEELKGVKAYLELQLLRYPGRIQVHYQIPEELEELAVPKLTLQPLVENSIQHGMAGKRPGITLVLSAGLKQDQWVLTVEDDGLGIPSQQIAAISQGNAPSKEGNGIGCCNIDRRIKLYFGQEYGLTLFSEVEKGTKAQINLPIKTVSDFETDNQNFG